MAQRPPCDMLRKRPREDALLEAERSHQRARVAGLDEELLDEMLRGLERERENRNLRLRIGGLNDIIDRERERARESVEENRILRLRVAQLGEILAQRTDEREQKKISRFLDNAYIRLRAGMAPGEARRVDLQLVHGLQSAAGLVYPEAVRTLRFPDDGGGGRHRRADPGPHGRLAVKLTVRPSSGCSVVLATHTAGVSVDGYTLTLTANRGTSCAPRIPAPVSAADKRGGLASAAERGAPRCRLRTTLLPRTSSQVVSPPRPAR